MKVRVYNNNIEKALFVLKKKLTKEGVFKQVKLKRWYEKPSDKRRRKHREAMTRLYRSRVRVRSARRERR